MDKSNVTEEFERDAVRHITEGGYLVAEVSQRLGGSQHSLYEWRKKFGASNGKGGDEADEIRRLKKESDKACRDQGADWLQAPSRHLWRQASGRCRQHA